jgi:methionyl-tRNA synthetase
MYVWFEALMNYITTLGYPAGQELKDFWPGDTHVIGKDIVRFHAAIWPAMLIGLGLSLPKSIYVHGFITVDNSKISKSLGNVISPLELVSIYGTDATRYYLLRHIPSYDDGDFSWIKMENAYNTELGNELGNLVQRTVSMIRNYQNGVVGDLPPAVHDEGPYHEALEEYRFDRALDYVWDMIRSLNRYIDEEKPWTLAKDEAEKDHLTEVLAYVSSNLLLVAKLLIPFMPVSAQTIHDLFVGDDMPTKAELLFPRINKYTEAKHKQ